MSSLNELYIWMKSRENGRLEFKEAKHQFDRTKLTQYCCAFANEGGGRVVLGVTDQFPRKIVGSQAFLNLEAIKSHLIRTLSLKIEVEELLEEHRRVVVFTIPSRPMGVPVQCDGIYWMRRGEELVPMTADMLKRIFDEAIPDFSAQICPGAKFEDLNPNAINAFREEWMRKAGSHHIKHISEKQLLRDIEVISDSGVTYAALVLFGTHKALGQYLAQAEVVFEYRSSDLTGPAQHRIEYREGFFNFYNELWEKINLRNDNQHFQDGLFIFDIPTFNEKAVREVILNAISHRDYKSAGSVWVKQYPRRITIVSPGGFPSGITPQNMLWRQQPRNRRIADVFAKCGLVERAGQGADRIFEESIKQSKALPDFTHTDEYQVSLTLDGQIRDESFLRFLGKLDKKTLASFTVIDFLALDYVHREKPLPAEPPELKIQLKHLINLGVIESIGRGKSTQYMLCKKYYLHAGKSGIYTRKQGLDRDTNKELLLKHIRANNGARLSDLCQVLPSLSADQIRTLVKELKQNNLIHVRGKTKAGLWFFGPEESHLKPNSNLIPT
ncbi:MAG: putative DNA binding domain-containing protein [Verrucomicrobia bacterium]|nr:putative DNA binding domain-containing protein [Verrucomicrobiota bacterium]MDE3047367.1 putative DNA binding domain-containing protein [Verrucomicrobiota bacterium]